ncbi:MAG: T9SS type A sorting domain-containing protein [Saprospiraceae bacterium]
MKVSYKPTATRKRNFIGKPFSTPLSIPSSYGLLFCNRIWVTALSLAFVLFIFNPSTAKNLSTLDSHGSSEDSHIQFRFSNAHLNTDKLTYTIDIEVYTSVEASALYAMNTRFFYEADDLEFTSISNFKKGYGLINTLNRPIIGAKGSAKKMFNLSGVAGYINEGIELKNVDVQDWRVSTWEKLATVNFKVISDSFRDSGCASLVWDKQKNMDEGGLLLGSMGTTATIIGSSSGDLECTSAACAYIDFNWEMTSITAPFGLPQKNDCILFANDIEDEIVISEEYILEQNTPNPYFDNTTIAFSLPQGEEVTFTVYDAKGVLLHSITETYSAGRHSIDLDRNIELPTGTLMYMIETENYVSGYLKMIRLN